MARQFFLTVYPNFLDHELLHVVELIRVASGYIENIFLLFRLKFHFQ